jgi:hypothetical protein
MVAKRIASLYEPPPIGRPSSVITDVQRVYKLLSKIAEGNYVETAVKSAGIAKQTFYNWREQAQAGNIAAIALVDAIEKAEADAESDAVNDVKQAGKAGPQYWAASMTRLERRHPERWGKRGDDGNAPKVVVQIGVRDGDVSVALGEAKVPTLTATTQNP